MKLEEKIKKKYLYTSNNNLFKYFYFFIQKIKSKKKHVKFLVLEKKFLSKFHPFIHEGNISEISKKMEECIKNIERNANAKIMFYELSLQLMTLLKVNRKFVELN